MYREATIFSAALSFVVFFGIPRIPLIIARPNSLIPVCSLRNLRDNVITAPSTFYAKDTRLSETSSTSSSVRRCNRHLRNAIFKRGTGSLSRDAYGRTCQRLPSKCISKWHLRSLEKESGRGKRNTRSGNVMNACPIHIRDHCDAFYRSLKPPRR